MLQKIETVKEQIYWAYANLAMAHSAVSNQQNTYNKNNFMIRAKLFKRMKNGTMNMRTIFDDEKIKLQIIGSNLMNEKKAPFLN